MVKEKKLLIRNNDESMKLSRLIKTWGFISEKLYQIPETLMINVFFKYSYMSQKRVPTLTFEQLKFVKQDLSHVSTFWRILEIRPHAKVGVVRG